MDITTLIGLVACFCFVFLGIVTGNEGFASLGHFGDTVSVFITLGGLLLYAYSGKKYWRIRRMLEIIYTCIKEK